MKANLVKFDAPVLGDGTQELYTKLYGEAGEAFLKILNISPGEIAVISRLIASLKEGGEKDEHQENRM